jgi:hypothetical protein
MNRTTPVQCEALERPDRWRAPRPKDWNLGPGAVPDASPLPISGPFARSPAHDFLDALRTQSRYDRGLVGL